MRAAAGRTGGLGRRAFAAAALAFALAGGCESYWEERERQRERRRLEEERANLVERKRQLRESIDRMSAGKTEFTPQQKAALGPPTVELNAAENRLREIDARFREL